MTILLTGFGPFPGVPENPTEKIAAKLDEVRLVSSKVTSCILPVSLERAYGLMEKACHQETRAVLNLGVSQKIERIHIETRGVNHFQSEIGDIDGRGVGSWPIELEGPTDRFTTLPCQEINRRLHNKEIDCAVSNDAGRYLCNWIYYKGLASSIPTLFVHVPTLGDKWTLPKLTKAIQIILTVVDDATRQERATS